jgi:hypothetical protein
LTKYRHGALRLSATLLQYGEKNGVLANGSRAVQPVRRTLESHYRSAWR